ncbi:MAG: helix-turn-helix transcriptional regulator [Coriobacteriia bacterium]|nr:helix-turn-helix transcriptional regulator [Coriobacteriia bacterium]
MPDYPPDKLSSHGEALEESAARGSGWFAQIPKVPLFFLGIGIYRAWIELVYVRPLVNFPTWDVAGHDVFDLAMVVVLLLCAALSRRLVPISEKRWVLWSTGALMVAGTILSFWSIYDPAIATWAAFPGAIAAGVGTAGMILLWSEFFGCLNPTRVALYYSLSLLWGAFVVLVMKGLVFSYLAIFTTALPILSLICVAMSFGAIPAADRPKRTWGKFSFPWKPVALMAVYAFAHGLRESALYSESGPHSSWGVVVAAAIVVVGVLSRHESFDFAIIYRVGLPLMVGGLLLVPLFSGVGTHVSNFCVAASYTSFSILIMLILSNITYRYGVGAVWLFGIERGFRALVMWFGRMTNNLFDAIGLSANTQSAVISVAVVLLIVACTMIFLSEKELSSRWGITLLGGEKRDDQLEEKNRVANLCVKLAAQHNLSPREAEVLQLLALGKSIGDIERELVIARGTAKAHLGHVYGKLNIHTRNELFEMLGVSAETLGR